MWSLLFCIIRTSILSRCMAARTAAQRRSSSAVETGVFRRSDRAMSFSPGGGFAHDVDHAPGLAVEEAAHIVRDRRHGAVLVALRIAAEMRDALQVLGLPQRAIRRQRLFGVDVERGAGDLAAVE